MEAAGDENLLYNVRQKQPLLFNMLTTPRPHSLPPKTIEELDAVKCNDTWNGRQVIFQQVPKQDVFNVLDISAC
jgi:hypothetical protein